MGFQVKASRHRGVGLEGCLEVAGSKCSQRPVSSSAGWGERLSAEVGSGNGPTKGHRSAPGPVGLHTHVLLTQSRTLTPTSQFLCACSSHSCGHLLSHKIYVGHMRNSLTDLSLVLFSFAGGSGEAQPDAGPPPAGMCELGASANALPTLFSPKFFCFLKKKYTVFRSCLSPGGQV